MLKFQSEWPLLAEVGRINRLTTSEIILLFALREVEAGYKGDEYNILRVQNTDLGTQANAMAYLIRRIEYQYQRYIRGDASILKINDKPVPFIEFLRYPSLTSEIGIRDQAWKDKLENTMDLIDKEFQFK